MNSLNIMMFFRYPPFDTRAGGGEVVEWNTLLELAKRGHSIHVVIGKSQNLPKVPNATFHVIPSYSRHGVIDYTSSILYLIKSSSFKNIDLIHGFHPEMVFINMFYKMIKKPIIHEIHFPQLYPYTFEDILKYRNRPKAMRWALHLHCDKLAAMCSKKVITPSNYMKNLIVRTYNLHNEKILVVPNGINEDILQIQRQNQKNGKIKLLFIGRLVPQKGIDVLIKSIKNINSIYNIELNIIGEGKQKKEYFQLAKMLKISNFINFIGFTTEYTKIKYLMESDILIVPSRSESFGITVVEGMSAELPVIGSAVGGIPELINHNKTGILVPPNNVQALANAIIDLIDNPDKRDRLGKAAKKFAKNNFTWRKRADRVEEIYREITSG